MKLTGLKVTPLLLLLFVTLVSCDTENPFRFEPPDFSTVPEPYDTSGVESVELEEGLQAYIHDEGYGPFEVTARDQVSIFLTLRTESGEVIYSTFSSSRTDPILISMNLSGGEDFNVHQIINQQQYTIYLAYTPGFKEGLLGMQDGEKRTLVVSPEKAYKNIPTNSINQSYKDSTLIYDIQISDIGPAKTR